jgi:hypothetical protein
MRRYEARGVPKPRTARRHSLTVNYPARKAQEMRCAVLRAVLARTSPSARMCVPDHSGLGTLTAVVLAATQPQDRCAMPPASSHAQPANACFTQLQAGFFAHSGSQPQAAPPGALSSQYQPLGQSASPQGEQVPSSQLAFAAGASPGPAVSLSVPPLSASASALSALAPAPSADAAGFSAPPQAAESAKRASPRPRTLRTVMLRRYPELLWPG